MSNLLMRVDLFLNQTTENTETYNQRSPKLISKMKQTGSRKHKREALSRFRSGCILCLSLGFERVEPQENLPVEPRLEVSVISSKKQVSKKAVERNRAKRRIRACLSDLNAEAILTITHSKNLAKVQCLVVCHRSCLSVPFEQLKGDVQRALEHCLLLIKV
jgi:ribonuclease P protein component